MFIESAKRRKQKRKAQKTYLRKHPEVRNRLRYKNYKRGAKYNKNFRSNWTVEEHRLITSPDHPYDRTLSKELGRTVQAIQAERCRFRKVLSKT